MAGGQGPVSLDQPFAVQNIRDARHGFGRLVAQLRLGNLRAGGDFGVEQAVRVVEGRPEHLAAGKVLVGRRHAPFGMHGGGVDGARVAETRQGGAVGAHQEDRLDEIAARLHDGERCELAS